MKKLLGAFCTLFLVGSSLSLNAQKLTDYVNPFVGTDGYGNMYPGSQAPFGGIQISPDTDDNFYDAAAGYKYNHNSIMGFSLTHLSGTGIPDLGDFLFMPSTGKVQFEAGTRETPDSGYRSRYSHDSEWARPGYYAVKLTDNDVLAEMTSLVYSGMFRFTYPDNAQNSHVSHDFQDSQDSQNHLIIDLDHTLLHKCVWSNLRIENDSTIVGSKLVDGWGPERHVYFAAHFSKSLENARIYEDGKPVIYNTSRFRSAKEAWGTKLMVVIPFSENQENTSLKNPGTKNQLLVKVAVSGVSTEGAKKNLTEITNMNFDQIKDASDQMWEKELAKYEVKGDKKTLRTFYTSAYHTALSPFVFEDIDGSFRNLDKAIEKSNGFTNMTVFSLWDTYRDRKSVV